MTQTDMIQADLCAPCGAPFDDGARKRGRGRVVTVATMPETFARRSA